MMAKVARQQPCEQVITAAGAVADNQRDGPAPVEIRDGLGARVRRKRKTGEE
jgi:hypothetical protein